MSEPHPVSTACSIVSLVDLAQNVTQIGNVRMVRSGFHFLCGSVPSTASKLVVSNFQLLMFHVDCPQPPDMGIISFLVS